MILRNKNFFAQNSVAPQGGAAIVDPQRRKRRRIVRLVIGGETEFGQTGRWPGNNLFTHYTWRLLAQNRYLLSSGEDDGQATAKIGRSIFRFEYLDKLSTGVSVHAMAIDKLAVDSIRRRWAVTSPSNSLIYL